jgi:chromosome segregation ATPase
MLQSSIQQLQNQIQVLEAKISSVQNEIVQQEKDYTNSKLLLEKKLKTEIELADDIQLFLPFDPNLEINLTPQEIKSILHND